jgi:ribose transport system substrate-binding protein
MFIRKLASVVGLAVVLSACSSAVPSEPAGSAGSAGSSTAAYKLGWYAPAPHPFFESVKKGVEQFVKDTGIPVDMQIGPDFTQESQNQRVEAMAAQGINGLAIYPADAVGANGLYEELAGNGMQIVNFGADSKRPNKSAFAVATDVSKAAYTACTEMIKRMGDKGNIINVLEVLEDPNTALRKEAVTKCVSEHPNVKIIQEVAGIKSSDEAVSKIESALSANADSVDGIIATGFNPYVGLATMLPDYYAKHQGKHIVTVTIDTDPSVTKAIQDGVIDGTIAQNPAGQGYISMKVLTMLLDGYHPVGTATTIESGDVFVTKDNLTTYETDLDAVTKQILADLPTKYLTK